jgi:hypothetical protein
MHGFFEISSRIATPLALAGFFGAGLLFILRQIIQARLIPPVRRYEAAAVLLHIINWMCVLCVVAMVLGFAGYVIRRFDPAPRSPAGDGPPFYVSTTWQSRSLWPPMWFVDEYHPRLKRATQVREATLLEFTNLKPVPIMIASYAFETELPNGSWERMETVVPDSSTHGKIFFGENLERVSEIRYRTFDSAIENKNIAPNETVRGWVIFHYWYDGKRRLVVKDTTGLVAAELISSGFEKESKVAEANPWPLKPVQPILSELLPDFTDISTLPVW